ncbi:hypothetical protein AT864_01219 [Anoxybacillus sp. P3H1B]|uniref:dipeptidase n=1 Tax=Anoxybacillus sp. P3H1B TaxID=1769293 RepID=UPI0007923EB1|nr:dipeptidase [Anoxybacillus sp. P3H1B]KXG10628.1 hypothetical protein AT864_01219 [Anoxybacillus sp. P3H1B]
MIFDAHCDVLMKLWLNRTLSFYDSKELHVTLQSLMNINSKVQCFAIYVPERVPEEIRFTAALEMVDLFFEKIVARFPNVKFVQSKADISALADDEIGAMLTLEGCEAIGTNLIKLKTLLRLGVMSVGLTWNWANAVADGAWEKRGAGLTQFGKEVIQQLNEMKRWTDVSHLSEKAFWDVMEIAQFPIASHSNAYLLCPHPRNLRDEQIQAIIRKNGMIGLSFVPYFLSENAEQAAVLDVLRHLEHVCSLGGSRHVGFGSDFDGIETTAAGLENARGYENLINELQKRYSETDVEQFLFRNFYEHLPQ